MKMSVIYHSVSGNTKHMAEVIAAGMNSVEGVEAQAFSIDAVDFPFAQESQCIVLGAPTYMADSSAAFHTWMEQQFRNTAPVGKLGGAFATAQYVHGGDEFVVRNILNFEMVMGMLTYSGGGSKGKPVIHVGPTAIATAGNLEALKPFEETFHIYGQRMAEKALELFGNK